MIMKNRWFIISIYFLLFLFVGNNFALAQFKSVEKRVTSKVAVFFSPSTGSFLEGSTFEVSVFTNTYDKSINTIKLHVKFDPNKLSVINRSGNTSVVGIWLQTPSYSNTTGSIQLTGAIPNGLVTDSGLITTLTFKALITGETYLEILPDTKILLNDGSGTEAVTEFGHGQYTILPKAPKGVEVFSDTHPFQDEWYNSNNPVLQWQKTEGVSQFSYVLDDKPFTVPDNSQISTTTTISFNNLPDGIKYFHLRAQKQGVWGATTNFAIRIDTTPPAEFTPRREVLGSAIVTNNLIFFETTDALSGLDYYEVGVLDKTANPKSSPLFVQTESPYQLASSISGDVRVVVRAFDKAGNVRDESVDIFVQSDLWKFILNNKLLILIILLIILHFLFGHRVIFHIKRIFSFSKKEIISDESLKDETLQEKTTEDNNYQNLKDDFKI